MHWFLTALFLFFTGCSSGEKGALETVETLAAFADVELNGDRPWDIQVRNQAFGEVVLREGSLGLGESYMAGWWDCKALDELFFRVLRTGIENRLDLSWKTLFGIAKAKFFNLQTKSGSLKVIHEHYQLGNDLFQHMLDPTMAYSCGYWRHASTLEEAQLAKYDLIARKLGMKPGMRVLDIGCGWGGFAKYIAERYGVSVVGITLSENQAEYAREVTKGLSVEIRVQDYRDLKETFDRVVEIGMFEHVGVKNYRTFMETVHRCLKPDGMLMLHTIGSNTTSNGGDPWLDKYIFPHAHLPSVVQIGEAVEGLFVMEDWHNFSVDYDKTLMAWVKNFDANWEKVKGGYPDPFQRMWRYYLLCCAGAFRARTVQLWQVVLSKSGVLGGHDSVR